MRFPPILRYIYSDSKTNTGGKLMSFWKIPLPVAGMLLSLALAACIPLETPPAPTQVIDHPTLAIATAVPPTQTPPAPTVTASEVPPTQAAGGATSTSNTIGQAAATQGAKLLGVPESHVKVLSVERVEWADPSLGCPVPGLQYNPRTLPGYSIKLDVDGVPYELHTDDSGRSVLCDADGQRVLPGLKVTPGSINDGSPWQPVN
jgi:hypothetical protein